MNLLDSSRSRTLDRHYIALSREDTLVLQLLHRDSLWAIDQSFDVEEIRILVDLRNPAVISDEVIFVSGDWSGNESILYPLSASFIPGLFWY